MKKIKIAGVPEHFNLPWHLAIEDGAFENRGIDLEWTEVPEGTGRMCTMLRDGETDIAIILTEGIVKDIVAGNPSKIVQVFVQSPLYWGIHVAANSSNKKVADLKDKKAAISRYGSGSHLMAVVNANNNGWSYKNLEFEVVNNVDGAIEALNNGTADYFMWEHFTTKPLVDKGIFRRVDDCPTPWPCFVIAVTDKLLEKSPSLVNHILEVINTYTEDFKDIPSIDRMLANRYEQKVEDIQEWLSITRWSQENITPIMVKNIQEQLERLAIIEKTLPYSKIVTKV
ncbi:ABC-type nitrate/sulfonate/bicarbonate transport system, periplasmic component [Galbibacter orientalis DSM 19592]|uniref:ABC-type nitrate/sulfonate/bicarbonate transport system, periplasmic component n=1 Tax=Galbibacter orientalis DSM 19592 TaxID=926559 RepID=I3CA66_9FLAO|nr:substrate-binding domain-containing protein [Galbibacter orientalis]EIJ40509.1 ABC-type nitrate/sulfonate/bicarbonate transport system, periplasmic component [Galbibacter orientalis DSM 19592]